MPRLRDGFSKEKVNGTTEKFWNWKIKKQIMENPNTQTYHIGGMTCGGCAAAVDKKLSTIAGVSSVEVNLGKKEAEISSSEPINLETLKQALENTNYTIDKL